MAMSWKNFPFWDLSKWYRYSPPHPEEDFFGNSASKKASQKRRKRTKAVSKRASPNEPASRVGSPQELPSHATQTEDANAHLAKRVYPTPAAAWAPPRKRFILLRCQSTPKSSRYTSGPDTMLDNPGPTTIRASLLIRVWSYGVFSVSRYHSLYKAAVRIVGRLDRLRKDIFSLHQGHKAKKQATNVATVSQYPGAYGREPYGSYHEITSVPIQEQLFRTRDKERFLRARSNEDHFTRTCVLVAICVMNAGIAVAMILLFLGDAMLRMADGVTGGLGYSGYRCHHDDYRYRDPYHLTACVFHGSADGLAISHDGVHFGLSRFPFAFCRLAIFCCPPLGDNLEPQDANDLATEFASRALQNNPVVHVFMMLGDGSDAGKDQFAALEKDLTAGFLAPDVGKRYKAWNYTGVVLRWPETTSSVTWHRMAPLLRGAGEAARLAESRSQLGRRAAPGQLGCGHGARSPPTSARRTCSSCHPPWITITPLALRYYSQRTLAALGDLNLRFLSRSLRGRQCYLFPADTYTYRIKPPDTTHSLGPGVQGPRTNRAGRMAYFETCPMADSYSKLFTDYGVEALLNDSLLVYTEPQLLARFADYMHQSLSATCMGVWNPHMDDFGGVCGYGVYPLCGALFRYYNDTHE
ncbi:hypothetical protein MRX96_044549 [Rhipicephalus microplus]